MSHRATSTAPMARSVVLRLRCHIACHSRSRSSGSWPSTSGFRNRMSDAPSIAAPRDEEPRNAWPSTPSSVRTVSSPSSLLPLKRPLWRPYVVAGIPLQVKSVSVTSVIFIVGLHGVGGDRRSLPRSTRAARVPTPACRDGRRSSGAARLQQTIGGGGARRAPARRLVHAPRDPGQQAALTLGDAPLLD